MMLSDVCLSDVCLSVAYIGPKSRTERPKKTKIGIEVAHVTCDSDTIFKVKRWGEYCGGLPHSLLVCGLAQPSGTSLKAVLIYTVAQPTSA